jgi:hypothetical protein
MNTAQRKFLIERIQKKVKDKIEILKKEKLQYPSASNYIFKAIMNNELKLQSEECILNAIKEKALKAKEGENWMSEDRIGFEKESTIKLMFRGLIVVPEDYKTEYDRVSDFNKSIQNQIAELNIQLDTIEVRVQLASDKTLQKLINEVDDMGDLSLVDTKLKLLS